MTAHDHNFPLYRAEFTDGEIITAPSLDNQRMQIAAQSASRWDGRPTHVLFIGTLTAAQAAVYQGRGDGHQPT